MHGCAGIDGRASLSWSNARDKELFKRSEVDSVTALLAWTYSVNCNEEPSISLLIQRRIPIREDNTGHPSFSTR